MEESQFVEKRFLDDLMLISAFLGRFSNIADNLVEKYEPVFFQFQVQYELDMKYGIEKLAKTNVSVDKARQRLEEFFSIQDDYRMNNNLKLPSKFIEECEKIYNYPFEITISSLFDPSSDLNKGLFSRFLNYSR